MGREERFSDRGVKAGPEIEGPGRLLNEEKGKRTEGIFGAHSSAMAKKREE